MFIHSGQKYILSLCIGTPPSVDPYLLFVPYVTQVAPLDMFKETNTGTNLPAQVELYATPGNFYNFLFMAKGGGSANKTFLYQQTKALLKPEKLASFVNEKIKVISFLLPKKKIVEKMDSQK